MRALRYAVYTLFLLLLLLALGAAWVLPRLPELAARFAQPALAPYGVEDVELEGLVASRDALVLQRIRLRGRSDGLVFEAAAQDLRVDFHWRGLLRGELGEVRLDQVDVALQQLPGSGPGNPPASGPLALSPLLPGNLLPPLPLRSAVIDTFTLRYRGLTGPLLVATGSLRLDDELHITFLAGPATDPVDRCAAGSLTSGDSSPLDLELVLHDPSALRNTELRAQMSPQGERWHWRLDGEADLGGLLDRLRGLPALAGIESLPAPPAGLALDGRAAFSGTVSHPDVLPASTAQLRAQLDANLDLHLDLEQLDLDQQLSLAPAQFDATLVLTAGAAELTLPAPALAGTVEPALLSLPADTVAWLQWDGPIPFSLQGNQPLVLGRSPAGDWRLGADTLRLLLGNNRSLVRLEPLALAVAAQGTPGNVELDFRSALHTRLRGESLPDTTLQADFDRRGGQDRLELSLADTAGGLQIDLQGEGQLAAGAGSLALQVVSPDLSPLATNLLPALRGLALPVPELTLDAGTLSISSEVTIGDFDTATWRPQTEFALAGVSGTSGEYRFENLSVTASIEGLERVRTRQPLTLSLQQLDVGFAISAIQARLALPDYTPSSAPAGRLEHFAANLFGGQVYLSEAATLDAAASSNSLTLLARDWQLGQIVALQQEQQISAQGVLEGKLPVRVSNGRLVIDGGYLRALPPGGAIRYSADSDGSALASGSAQLGQALELLRDFRYEVLSSEVQLDDEGQLLLGLSLGGMNPAFYDGRRVNFNINLEQNLYPLLQSLRLSDNLVKKIEGGAR